MKPLAKIVQSASASTGIQFRRSEYGHAAARDFLRDVIAMANASVEGQRYIVVGVAFKFGAVPFHMWLPDVYEGAPTPVTLFIGSVPKIAAFALAWRILIEALAPMSVSWQAMLIILCVLSLLIGNIVAIAQTNLKRLLAYSTISHVGFILMGVLRS